MIDLWYIMSVFTNGFFMLVAVYSPRIFGGGFWSRLVFTLNFIVVLSSFGELVRRGMI